MPWMERSEDLITSCGKVLYIDRVALNVPQLLERVRGLEIALNAVDRTTYFLDATGDRIVGSSLPIFCGERVLTVMRSWRSGEGRSRSDFKIALGLILSGHADSDSIIRTVISISTMAEASSPPPEHEVGTASPQPGPTVPAAPQPTPPPQPTASRKRKRAPPPPAASPAPSDPGNGNAASNPPESVLPYSTFQLR
jgi:hypothetical protein